MASSIDQVSATVPAVIFFSHDASYHAIFPKTWLISRRNQHAMPHVFRLNGHHSINDGEADRSEKCHGKYFDHLEKETLRSMAGPDRSTLAMSFWRHVQRNS